MPSTLRINETYYVCPKREDCRGNTADVAFDQESAEKKGWKFVAGNEATCPDCAKYKGKLYTVGISGGKDSAAVLLWLVNESGIPHDQIECTFADTGNEHEWTYLHVQRMSEQIFPVTRIEPEKDYYDLAFSKRRFPGAKARFCTQFLKIFPSQEYIAQRSAEGYEVISVSGVRADESFERSKLDEFEWNELHGNLLVKQWRPLLKWTIDDVIAIHEKYNFPLNPLYAAGARRVGCFPCIMSRKAEIRLIALRFPERIDMIREWEQKFEKEYGRYSSFFPRKVVPPRFWSKPYTVNGEQQYDDNGEPMMIATIDDVVRWSMTGKRAQGSYLDDEDENENPLSCNSGFCE